MFYRNEFRKLLIKKQEERYELTKNKYEWQVFLSFLLKQWCQYHYFKLKKWMRIAIGIKKSSLLFDFFVAGLMLFFLF